jgi:hypothetical protein
MKKTEKYTSEIGRRRNTDGSKSGKEDEKGGLGDLARRLLWN